MGNQQRITDYYSLLHVDPQCDARILEIAYHHFAKLYHPDHAETADIDKFNEVVEAYKVLKDPKKRAEYDRVHLNGSARIPDKSELIRELDIDGKDAVNDAEIHEKILLYLYKKRRENPNDAGISGWVLQEVLECSDDHFEFHIWYLKSKGFIELTEQGTLAVSIDGVDHVISMCRDNSREELLIGKAEGTKD